MKFAVHEFSIGLGPFINFNTEEVFLDPLFGFVRFSGFGPRSGDSL